MNIIKGMDRIVLVIAIISIVFGFAAGYQIYWDSKSVKIYSDDEKPPVGYIYQGSFPSDLYGMSTLQTFKPYKAYRMIRDGKANVVHLSAFSHPNVVTGQDQIPGAVTRGTTVRRVNEWCRSLVDGEQIDGECFELPQFLEGAIGKSQSGREYPPLKPGYYKIMEPAFSYMVLGQYPAKGSNQLISKEWISQARSRWDVYVSQYGEIPPQGTSAIMGQDVGEFGTDANVACFRYGGYVERLIAWN